MKIFRTLDSINNDRECAIALGLFDGLHRAHRAVIASAVESGLEPAVFTFTMDSVTPDSKKDFRPLMSLESRIKGIEALGARLLLIPDFSEFAGLSAEVFVEDVLIKRMKARHICCGYDFRFGKDNRGDVSLLKSLCDRHGIELSVTERVSVNGREISSSAIRHALAQGDMQTYFDMNGRYYTVESAVLHGNRIGRTMSFPTVNQPIDTDCAVARFGVYASYTYVDGKRYPSVTNVGTKPTVSSDATVLAETNIFDFDGDLYGRCPTVELVHFLRDERRFGSVDELRTAIEADRESARALLKP